MQTNSKKFNQNQKIQKNSKLFKKIQNRFKKIQKNSKKKNKSKLFKKIQNNSEQN